MPVCKTCKKLFVSDCCTKRYCYDPCRPVNYTKKTWAERWLDKKPRKPQRKRLSSIDTQGDG